jgi:hypothetical protein
MKTIRKTYITLTLATLCLAFPTCNDEWEEEQYEKTVAFVKSGYTEVYLKYRGNGVAPYKIPLVVSGSTPNDKNVEVTVAVDPDTIDDLNLGRFYKREDLYFKQLDESHYKLKSNTVTIPAGEDVGLLDVDFNLQGLDMVHKYILPLEITATSAYVPSPRKWYKKTLMRIVPFNDYSGKYIPTDGRVYSKIGSDSEVDLGVYEVQRETHVVGDSTVFFYAGLIQEEASYRALYKIRMLFKDNGTLELTADSAQQIDFQQDDFSAEYRSRYEVTTESDPKMPYLEQRYTVVRMAYSFSDKSTYTGVTMRYRIICSATMQRTRNTLIPEEDQQFIFD